MVHELKTWPKFFRAIVDGEKTFEVRKDDRGFAVGDALWLREWNPDTKRYGAGYVRRVCYVLKGGQFGVEPGYAVLALTEPTNDDIRAVSQYRNAKKPAPDKAP